MTGAQPSVQTGAELGLFSKASFPELYEQALVGPLFRPWVGPLLDAVELRSGDHLLDLACGTGIVGRVARERVGPAGSVVGVDLNPQMLAAARRIDPAINWRQGDAGALPLEDGERFTVVACQQGFQFFAHPAAAARQIHRALVPGGRLGISTWRPDQEFPVLAELRRIAERHVGPITDRRHALGEPDRIEATLRDAGFRDIRTTRSSKSITFPNGWVFVRLNAMALIGMSALGASLGDNERQGLLQDIVHNSANVVRQHSHASGFRYEIGTNLVTAIRSR
jgi:ubiquinone/menaquinone biosynthesis C-methylase UbiE